MGISNTSTLSLFAPYPFNQLQPQRTLTAAEQKELRYEQGDVSTPSNAQLKAWELQESNIVRCTQSCCRFL